MIDGNTKLINEYLNKESWRVKENANFNFSHSGLLSHVANNVLANYALAHLPKEVRQAHKNGLVHIHNLEGGMLTGYCHGGSLQSLLINGVRSADVSSKPAKHFDTVLDHIMNYIYMSQLEWSGAQAMSDVDTMLAPFIRYDGVSYKQLKQSLQRFVYNLNFACRQAFQTPFSNITLNMGVPNNFKDRNVIVGGRMCGDTYSDFQTEIEMFNKAFAEVLMERDSKGRPFTFPIPTLNLSSRIDWDSEAMRTIMEEVAVLGSYYFMNYIGSGISEDSVRAMCCRLNLDLTELSSARGAWNMGDGTGSLGVVSLNMSQIGYVCRGKDIAVLQEKIYEAMSIAKRQLVIKRRMVEKSLERGYLPFAKFYGINLDHYFLTVGVIGLNEMMVNWCGKRLSEAPDVVAEILQFMRQVLRDFQIETGYLFNLEMTPAEGSSYRLAVKDRLRFKNIFTQGTKESPFYTALLVPPSERMSVFERLITEEKILPHFSGGTTCRVYLGETPDVGALTKFVRRIAQTRTPYFDITSTFGICLNDGRLFNGTAELCPDCGSDMDVFTRTVGYYRPSSKYNIGKRQEFSERTYVSV